MAPKLGFGATVQSGATVPHCTQCGAAVHTPKGVCAPTACTYSDWFSAIRARCTRA